MQIHELLIFQMKRRIFKKSAGKKHYAKLKKLILKVKSFIKLAPNCQLPMSSKKIYYHLENSI